MTFISLIKKMDLKKVSMIASIVSAGINIGVDAISKKTAMDDLVKSKELDELVAKKVAEALETR